MRNHISTTVEDRRRQEDQGPQRIDKVLAELLVQYQARFPEVRISLLETPVHAA